jgi:hypothetical protein
MSRKWDFPACQKIPNFEIGNIRGTNKCALGQRRFLYKRAAYFIGQSVFVINNRTAISTERLVSECINPITLKICHGATLSSHHEKAIICS